MWSGHVVWDKTGGTRYAHRPGAGRLALSFETSRPLDAPDRCVVDPAFVRGVSSASPNSTVRPQGGAGPWAVHGDVAICVAPPAGAATKGWSWCTSCDLRRFTHVAMSTHLPKTRVG